MTNQHGNNFADLSRVTTNMLQVDVSKIKAELMEDLDNVLSQISDQLNHECRVPQQVEQSLNDTFFGISPATSLEAECDNSVVSGTQFYSTQAENLHLFDQTSQLYQGEFPATDAYETVASLHRLQSSPSTSLCPQHKLAPTWYIFPSEDALSHPHLSHPHHPQQQQHHQYCTITDQQRQTYSPSDIKYSELSRFEYSCTNPCSAGCLTNKMYTNNTYFNSNDGPNNEIFTRAADTNNTNRDTSNNLGYIQTISDASSYSHDNDFPTVNALPDFPRVEELFAEVKYNSLLYEHGMCHGNNCYEDSGVSRSNSSSSMDCEPLFPDFKADQVDSESDQLDSWNHDQVRDPLYVTCYGCCQCQVQFPSLDSGHYGCSLVQENVFSTYFQGGSITEATYTPRQSADMQISYTEDGSPLPDEGFDEPVIPEEKLPLFSEIQHTDSDRDSQSSHSISSGPKEKKKAVREFVPSVEKERRKPGRKPGQVSNVLHLWEFMRDLLHSQDSQGIIEWISRQDGVFQVKNSSEVARLWGEKKKNKKKMTYEKLSRSLRYSRLEGYFADLPKDKEYPKKLCFKFGPKSKNWH